MSAGNNPSIWQPTTSATDGVPNLSYLSGVQIPVPEDGILVFVVDTGTGPSSGFEYQLSLLSGAPIDGFNVIGTFLGGTSRWLRRQFGNDANGALVGSTPGLAPGESVELVYSPAHYLTLTDGDGYVIELECVASGVIAGVPNFSTFTQQIAARQVGGVLTLASGSQEVIGELGAGTWTFAASVGAAPTRVALTFTTGATTAKTNVSCNVTLTPVISAA